MPSIERPIVVTLPQWRVLAALGTDGRYFTVANAEMIRSWPSSRYPQTQSRDNTRGQDA